MTARKPAPDEAHREDIAAWEALTKVRPVDGSEVHLLEDTERLKRELSRAQPGHESAPLSLMAPRRVGARIDRARFEQVLDNLLENAIKFGEKRPVQVGVHREGDRAVVQVIDHGLGVAAEHQARIFERFERAVPRRQFGGLGLGLWIGRNIVTALGGTIGVRSEPDVETVFTVELPAAD